MGISRQRLHMILKNESTLLARVDNIAIALELDPKDILM
jgi:DNA-binding Xre family transcriptional regulator